MQEADRPYMQYFIFNNVVGTVGGKIDGSVDL